MGWLQRLFGGGGGGGPEGGEAAAGAPDRGQMVEHQEYRIIPVARRQGGQFLTAALIEKDGEGDTGVRRHDLVRADTHGSAEAAATFAIQKARQAIDEQGDRLFNA